MRNACLAQEGLSVSISVLHLIIVLAFTSPKIGILQMSS
jgi:hypothetical protein